MRFRHSRHGSTLILVLAVLSILVLIAAALSVTARLETVSSSNYAQATQARMAAATGLPAALEYVREATSVTTLLQPWNLVPAMRNSIARSERDKATKKPGEDASSAAAGNVDPAGRSSRLTGQSLFAVSDLSARVNVNAITNERTFNRFLAAVFGDADASSAAAGAATRTNAIFQFRNTQPGTTTSLEPDLRKRPKPGTRRFETLGDLRQHPSISPHLFSDEELRVLANHITVFSMSPEVFNLPTGGSIPKVSLEGLSADEILKALERAFPDKDQRLLMQYAVNVADFADTDSIPSILKESGRSQPWNWLIGYEQTPLITEVYPDSATKEGGDQGQYVEIHNPWAVPVSLANWRLVVGGGPFGSPGTATVQINAVLPPGGFLIITDNYETPADNSAPETGSFLSIFGARRDGGRRQLIESPAFDLPDRNSYVTLLDDKGNLVDVFSYTDTAPANARESYQRNDPRVRAFGVAEAGPYESAPKPYYTGSASHLRAIQKSWEHGNSGTMTPAMLLAVSTAYAGLKTVGNRSVFEAHPWQVPEVAHLDPDGQRDAYASNMDAFVIDLFTAAKLEEPPFEIDATRLLEKAPSNPFLAQTAGSHPVAGRKGDNDDKIQPGTRTIHTFGKLNLNTCHKLALYAIDGVANGEDCISPAMIEQIESYRVQKYARREIPFLNVSDFLIEFYPKPTDNQLAGFGKILDQVTVGSASFEVVAENRNSPGGKEDSRQRFASARAKWTLALDFAPFSLIGYSLQPW